MATDDIALSLGIVFDAAHFKQEYERSFQQMERSTKKLLGKTDSAMAKFGVKLYQRFTQMPSMVDKATKAIAAHNNELHTQRDFIKDTNKEYDKQLKRLQELKAEMAEAGEAATDVHKADLEAVEKLTDSLRTQLKTAQQTYQGIEKEIESLQDSVEEVNLAFSAKELGGELLQIAGEAGREFVEPFSALLNKDIEGAGKSFAQTAGKWTGNIGKGIGKGLSFLGDKAQAKAGKMQQASAGGNVLASGALKGIGKLASSLGPMVQMLSKIGPMMGVAAGAVMSLVKLFLDADAAVKEFNRDMIAAGGTGQFFSKTAGSAAMKVNAMSDALDGFRNAAHDLKGNLDWGITADTHKEVLQNLQQEGVQLTTMQAQYQALSDKSAAFSKDQGSITQAAVAYSRQMGVSLQEVTGFQAEMMTEMGSTLAGTVNQFRIMSAGAEESGIATNKFFAMIRGVSADLSLYNTRLEDAVKLLGKLGKVMSPKNAQKFMQTAMNAYKGMSFQDKVKSSILAGPAKTAKIVAEDIASKNESIARKISEAGGGTVEDIKKALEAGPAGKDAVRKAIEQAEQKSGKGMGDVREAVSRLNIEKKRSKGGLVGNAAALSQVSAVGALEHKFAAATRFGKLGEGIGGEVSGQVGGMDEEEIMQAQIMKDAIDDQREKLIKEGKNRQKVEAMSWTQIYDTMDQAQKDAADGKDQQEEANKRVGKVTQDIYQKIDVLVQFLTNTFYNLMLNLWGSIQDIADKIGAGDKGQRKLAKMALEAMKSGNKDMAALADKSTSMADFENSLFKSKGGKEQERILTTNSKSKKEAEGKINDLRQREFDAKDPKEKEALEGQRKALEAQVAEQQKQYDAIRGALEKGMSKDKGEAGAQLASAAKMAGLDDKKAAFMEQAMKSGEGLEKSIQNLSGEEQGKVLEKLRLAIGPEKYAEAFADMNKVAPSLGDMAQEATKHGSIYTHDIHLEKLLEKKEGGGVAGLVAKDMAAKMAMIENVGGVDSAGGAALMETMGLSEADVEEMQAQLEQQETINGTLEEVVTALRQKGVRLDKSWMDNHMKKMVEEATLDALRVGLLEYYLLQTLGSGDVLAAMKNGLDPKALFKGLSEGAAKGQTPDEFIREKGGGGKGGGGAAAGGTPAAGTAPDGAPVTAGGTKTGGGGAGGDITVRVELSLKGDLGQLIDARAQQVIVRHEAAAGRR